MIPPMTSSDWNTALWTILIGILCNLSCALLGCYLVLRRMSLLGDAISHSVLPGIVLAFLLTGQLTGLPILVGAMVLGVLTALLTQLLQKSGVAEDASMGVVFTGLFALGVILMHNTQARKADLDPGCVLYGLLEFVSLDTEPVLGFEVPHALPTLTFALVLTLVFIVLLWKELKLVSFDPALATAMGINATLIHYLLMAMVAGVTVAAFEAVGSILVVAMLIVPAATAQLLTDRLVGMMAWASVVAVLSAVLGYLADAWLAHSTSLAGMMAVVAGLQFLLAVLLAPRHGVVSKVVRNARLGLRIVSEDLLGYLYRKEEATAEARPGVALLEARRAEGGMMGWLVLPGLWWRREIHFLPGWRIGLTEEGRQLAGLIVRAHRLWEAYLVENLEIPVDHLHEPAAWMEHFLGPGLQSELATQLGQRQTDPHGKQIPPS